MESVRSADAQRLIDVLSDDLSARYDGEDGRAGFTPEDVEVTGGAFLIARWDGQPVGCGALRPVSQGIGEVKRLFVAEEARRRGVGRALLTALETYAVEVGYSKIILETGVRQPEAIALYERFGYTAIPNYGRYADHPLSVCMAREMP
jgi:putative acetyltransferase